MDRIVRNDSLWSGSRSRAPSWPAAFLLLTVALWLPGCQVSLHDAIARNDLQRADQMLRENPSLLESRDHLEKTPLHHAVTFQRPDAVDFLLRQGAQVNATDVTGMTPLHTAAMFGRGREAEILLAAGADVTRRDRFGDTPLHTAAIFGAAELTGFLGEYGADPAARNAAGKTAFDLAIRYDHKRTALRLKRLEQGQ